MSVTLNTQLEDLMFSSQIPDIEIATSDDNMPYHIINLIESDDTLATCQMFNAEVSSNTISSNICYRVLSYHNTSCRPTIIAVIAGVV